MLNWLNPWRWWKIFQLHRRWKATNRQFIDTAIDLTFRTQLKQRLNNNPNSDNANWYRALLPKIDNHLAKFAQSRNISISELGTTAIGKAGIEGLIAVGAIDLHTSPDTQPWQSPYYWGAWISQG